LRKATNLSTGISSSLSLMISITLVYSCSNEYVESESSTPIQYTLNVIASEGGSVTPEATGTYDEGAQLTLSAIPEEGYVFCRWLGTDNDNLFCEKSEDRGAQGKSRCIILMNSNRDVEAFFEKKEEQAFIN
jgi:hypothetical protein